MSENPIGVLSYWNMKEFSQDSKLYSISEFPLYSDACTISEFKNGKGPYEFLGMNSRDRNTDVPGLIYDAITLRMFMYIDGQNEISVKTDTSRYHGGGIKDEIAALASLKLGIRLKAGTLTRIFLSDEKFGIPVSASGKKPTIDIGIGGAVLPSVVKKNVDISELENLFLLKSLSEEQYVALVRASRMYQDALWLAESEPELAWLMFISSLETAANQWSSEQGTPVERLKASKPDLAEVLIKSGGDKLVQKVADMIIDSLGATAKFTNFCLKFMPDAPEQRPPERGRVEWTKTSFRKILGKLYGYRSQALHGGTPFPAPLCFPPESTSREECPIEKGGLGGITTGTYGGTWSAEDLPISMDTFHYFANGVLNKWWSSLLLTKS